MEIYHQYVRLRKQFGRHPKFSDEGAEMFADIRPNEEHAKEYIPRNPIITGEDPCNAWPHASRRACFMPWATIQIDH